MKSRLAAGVAALALMGAATAAPALPAFAQDKGQGSDRCAAAGGGGNNPNNPGNAPYPPGQGNGKGVSDSSPARGQRMSASSGCAQFAPGQSVAFGVESVYQQLGTVVASLGGEATATFTVPTNLANGRHEVVFRGASLTGAPTEVRIPFTIAGGTYTGVGGGGQAAPGGGQSAAGGGKSAAGGGSVTVAGVSLPRTGSDAVVPLTALGLGLVAAGTGMVVVARRRRLDGAPAA